MRVPVRPRLAGLLSVASVAGLLVLSATAADAKSGPPASESAAAALSASVTSTTSSASGKGHFNVGNTHSPRLERELAGSASTSGGTGGNAPAQSAGTGTLQGIDISSHQHDGGPIDWSQVAAAGVQFVAVKTTESNYYQNPDALTDLAAARAAGLSVMAYAFGIPNGTGTGSGAGSPNPVTQANYLLNYLQTGSAGVPPIMLDIEYNPYGSECYGLTQAAMVKWIKGFDAQIQKKTGNLPLIYTTAGWWQTCTGNSAAFGEAPLWIAETGVSAPSTLPAGWKSWGFWQYSSTGTVNGITGNVDLDEVHPATIPLLNPGDRPQAAGNPVDMQVSTADPVAGQTLSYSASGLPGGLALNPATGQITGWINKAGAYQITVTATDSQSDLGSVTFTWTAGNAPVQAAGELHLDVGGKCLRDVGDKNVAGTQTNIWTCNGSDAEQWSYAQDETLRIHGLCLSTASTAKDGTKPSLRQCTGVLGQRWRLVYPRGVNPSAGARPIAFVNVGSGKCLADPNWSKTNGTRVVVAACNGYTNQVWRLPGGPLRSELGKCADDSGGATTPGTPAVLWACNGTAEQKILARQDGTMKVHGLCLEVSGGAVTSGTPVDLTTCDATAAAQQWHLLPDGGGVDLVNPQSKLCLASPGDTRVGGTQFQAVTCTPGDPGMVWRVS